MRKSGIPSFVTCWYSTLNNFCFIECPEQIVRPICILMTVNHNILGGTVYVIHQEFRADGASGQWKWETHPPIAPQSIDKVNKYYTGKDLYFITGNYFHFFLITVSNSTLPRTSPEMENVSQDEEIIPEAEETVETSWG